MTITGVTIPPVRIPETVVPRTSVGGRVVPARTFAVVEAEGGTVEAVTVPQTCQERTERGLVTITRPGVVRRAVSRNGVSRPGGTRKGACVDGACAPAVTVPTVRIPRVKVEDVDVDPLRLERTRLRDQVDTVEGGDRTAYVAPADVLFDVDKATLKPGATSALRLIAGRLKGGEQEIRVEGHTDSTNTDAYNLALSRRRAEAVATWLAKEGGIDHSRIAVLPRGESAPVASNATDRGRALNRRVVISVARS